MIKLIRAIKALLYRLQIRAERDARTRALLYLVFVLLVALAVLRDVLELAPSPSRWTNVLVYLLLVAIPFFIDLVHFNIVRSNRLELNGRREFIRRLIDAVEPEYEVETWHEKHIIQSNGDSEYIRTVWLKYGRRNTLWYEMTLGSTTEMGGDYRRMNVRAFRLPEKAPVPRVTYSTSSVSGKSIIILDPPLSELNPVVGLLIRVHWPKIWWRLVEEGWDDGKLMIKGPTERLTLEFVAPPGSRIADFMIRPTGGLSESVVNQEGANVWHCTFDKPKVGLYEYSFKLVEDLTE